MRKCQIRIVDKFQIPLCSEYLLRIIRECEVNQLELDIIQNTMRNPSIVSVPSTLLFLTLLSYCTIQIVNTVYAQI